MDSDLQVRVSLEHILDVGKLAEHVQNGYVSAKPHPTKRLVIYNYTPKAVTLKEWDDTISLCRGLIVDVVRREVVARPFKKFWNFNDPQHPETLAANLPKSTPQIMEKMDGSLGILYDFHGPEIATRGSFLSEQAQWATKWYSEHAGLLERGLDCKPLWPEDWTPLFEIVYPENRIVCSYDFKGLVLIGMVNNTTGEEMPHEELVKWAGRNAGRNALSVAPAYSHIPANDDTKNREGYVLTWFDPYIKVKVKFEEYCRLHRVITGLNEKTVWEMLSEEKGDELDKLVEDETFPAEFRNWLGDTVNEFDWRYKILQKQASNLYDLRPYTCQQKVIAAPEHHEQIRKTARKENALHFKKQPELAPICFAMLDEMPYAPIIWKMLKPKADKTFRVDGE